MAYAFHHVHLKAPDPKKTAEWFVRAFGFRVVSEADQFFVCETTDGVTVNISGARADQPDLGPGDANPHFGLEHFGMTVDDLDEEIERLTGMGAELMEAPRTVPSGTKFAFIKGPDDVRMELMQLS